MPRRFGPGFVAEADDGATLNLSWTKAKQRWAIHYTPSSDALKMAKELDPSLRFPSLPILLLKGDVSNDVLVQFPYMMDATSPNFLRKKYGNVRSLTLEGFGFDDISDMDSAEDALGSLPTGFVRSAYRGLGLNQDIRFIIDAIEKIPKINDLRIVKGARGTAAIKGSSYVLPYAIFETVRKDLGRVHDKALMAARVEKIARMNDKLLNTIDPKRFPIVGQPYHPDAIVKAVGDGLQQGLHVSKADAKIVVEAAAAMVRSIAQNEPSQLLKLTEEVETVTLEAMIAHMRARIADNHGEESWQKFLNENAFILRLVFGVPVLLFQEQATVGGRSYNGVGDKKTDFLMQAARSGNLAVIEIKAPTTPLLDNRDYRGGIYAPHRELSGAVNQVLDQRWHLQRNEMQLSDSLARQDREEDTNGRVRPQTYAIQCLVIAGTTPDKIDQQKSFELYRNGLSGVLVLTYDELLLKLQNLFSLLKNPEAKALKVPNVTIKKPRPRRTRGRLSARTTRSRR